MMATVLKTVSRASGSGVRIPPLPPVGKRKVWLALCEGSPADFRRKIEFFVFVPRSGTSEAGFSTELKFFDIINLKA